MNYPKRYEYKLRYRDQDDSNPKTLTSDTPIQQWDVVELSNGNFYFVTQCERANSGSRLILSAAFLSQQTAESERNAAKPE